MSPKAYTIDDFKALVGTDLGYSEWLLVDQARVDLFAGATGDHQWIHVDPERAKDGPFGGTIAHGYLTLSLAPTLLQQVWKVEGARLGVNYGCNKVRFPSPVPVGSEIRMGVAVAEAQEVDGGVQVVLDLTVEIRDKPKPACVAQVVYRYFR
ncbi:MAG: MaoC family dehydratase [Acidimicrobiales bacterium]